MAIRVAHGGKGSDTAGQIIAQAGQGEANRKSQEMRALLQYAASAGQQRGGRGGGGGGGGGGANYDEKALAITKLRNARAMQTEQIQAQAKRDTQAADDATAKTALKFGLDQQVQEQEFENTLKQKQEAARLQANQWKFEFTAKDKQEIAKFNQARRAISSALSAGEIDQQTADTMGLKVDMAQGGMEASMVPDDSQKYPEGQGPGQSWIAEDGSKMFRNKDGEERLILKPSETEKGIAASAAIKTKAAEVERAQAIEDTDNSNYSDRAMEQEKWLREEEVEFKTGGVDKDGDPNVDSRRRNATEMNDAMQEWRQFNPSPAEVKMQAEQAMIQQQQAAEQAMIQQQQAEMQRQADAKFEAFRDQLPVGAEYIAPDGTKMRKKAPKKDFTLGPFVPWSERR